MKREIVDFLEKLFNDKKYAKYFKKILPKDYFKLSDVDEIKKLNIEEKYISEFIKFIKSNQKFIPVIGKFSSGKTYFLNSLIGKDLLESASVPKTKFPWYITGGRNKLIITYKNNDKDKLKIKIKKKKIFFKSNKKNSIDSSSKEEFYEYLNKNGGIIDNILIYTKSKFFKKDIVFIDTPGINSLEDDFIKDYNFILTLSDIVIFMMNFSKPLEEKDIEFINNHLKGKKIIFLLSQIDMLDSSEDEINEIINFIRKGLTEKTDIKNPEITVLSAKDYKKAINKKDKVLIKDSNLTPFMKYLYKSISNL